MIKELKELNEEKFEIMELFDDFKVLMTCRRISRIIIPEGLYVYDLRHDDDCTGEICEIKPFVLVNHWGTIISKVPIEMGNDGYRLINTDDYSYSGGNTMTLKEYIKEYMESTV